MLSRKYDKKIQIFEITTVDDGFGGFTTTDALLASVWANIETRTSNRILDNGVKDYFQTTTFTIRNRTISQKENFIKYKAKTYVIDTIENLNLTGVDLTLNCSEYTK